MDYREKGTGYAQIYAYAHAREGNNAIKELSVSADGALNEIIVINPDTP